MLVLNKMIHPNQHMKSSIESTTSIPNHGHHLDAKQLYTNTLKHAHHGAQDELMHSTPDQHKITIIVTACSSWTLRSIESAKVSLSCQNSVPFQKSNHWIISYKELKNYYLILSNWTKGRHGNHPNNSKHWNNWSKYSRKQPMYQLQGWTQLLHPLHPLNHTHQHINILW